MSSHYVEPISVASEIRRLHDTIQEGLARDEVVYTKLERLVSILKSRSPDGIAGYGLDSPEHASGASLSLARQGQSEREKALSAEVKLLREELQGMTVLLHQNGQLEREVSRLCVELEEATEGVLQRGYLYKWRDRDISYASKWGLRYFVLQGSKLSYYGDDRDTSRPRRTFDMTKCIVRDEGTKKSGAYYVFTVYATGTLAGSAGSGADLGIGQVLLRLSSESRGEAMQWMHMLERSSATHTRRPSLSSFVTAPSSSSSPSSSSRLGGPAPQKDTSLRASRNPFDDDADPSTGGGGPESNIGLTVDTTRGPSTQPTNAVPDENLSPIALTRVKSSNKALAMAENLMLKRRPSMQGAQWTSPVPLRPFKPASFPGSRPMHLECRASPLSSEARPGETNYRGFFHLGVIVLIVSHLRVIFDNLLQYGLLMRAHIPFMSVLGVLNTGSEQGTDMDGSLDGGSWMRATRVIRSAATALVGVAADAADTLYMDTASGMGGDPAACLDERCAAMHTEGAPVDTLVTVGAVLVSWGLTVAMSWLVEVAAAAAMVRLGQTKQTRRVAWLSANLDHIVLLVHWVLGIINAFMPMVWVWQDGTHPIGSMIYLGQSVVLWMKMISYAHVNRDSRKAAYIRLVVDKAVVGTKEGGVAVKRPRLPSEDLSDADFTAMRNIEKPVQYPLNLTVGNIAYFCVAPTLCYQLNYPRSKRVRLRYLGTIFLRLFIVAGLVMFFVEQHMAPTLSGLSAWEQGNLTGLGLLLRLSIPNTYVWLLGFYWFFHLWMNMWAELTRFGDRLFYKDWWNARTIEAYWRTWNLPVHHWLARHVYYPVWRQGATKGQATIVVFFLSAVLHEVIISVPFKKLSLHAFFGMLAQAPLIWATKKLDRVFNNALVGNIIFWLVFCVIGQPIGIILIYFSHTQ